MLRPVAVLLWCAAACFAAEPAVVHLSEVDGRAADGNAHRNADADGQPIRVQGRPIEEGIGVSAPSRLTYKLDGHHRAFLATVAADDSAAHNLTMSFEVHLDGRRVGRTSPIDRAARPIDIAVDITGANELSLILHDQGDGHRGERGVWIDPRLSPEPATPQTDPRYVADRSIQQRLFFEPEQAGGPARRPYYLSLPRPLDEMKQGAPPWPMVVFLHGIAEGGDDHRRLFIEAVPLYLRDRPAFTARYPCIFVCPQVPYGQRFMTDDNATFVIELIEHLRDTLPVDPDRIYLTGLSDGGIGTWAIAQRRPDLFAAIAPVAARAVNPDDAGRILAQVPAWIIVGGYDTEQRRDAVRMMQSYRRHGGIYHYRVVPKFGHVIWDQAYLDPAIYEWLLQWRLGGRRAAPDDQPLEQSDEALAETLLNEADALRTAGRLVEAYDLYLRVRMEYPRSKAQRSASEAIGQIEADPAFIKAAKAAGDEASAGAMLEIARRYLRDGETDRARATLEEVVRIWPLTQAAIKAKYLLK